MAPFKQKDAIKCAPSGSTKACCWQLWACRWRPTWVNGETGPPSFIHKEESSKHNWEAILSPTQGPNNFKAEGPSEEEGLGQGGSKKNLPGWKTGGQENHQRGEPEAVSPSSSLPAMWRAPWNRQCLRTNKGTCGPTCQLHKFKGLHQVYFLPWSGRVPQGRQHSWATRGHMGRGKACIHGWHVGTWVPTLCLVYPFIQWWGKVDRGGLDKVAFTQRHLLDGSQKNCVF